MSEPTTDHAYIWIELRLDVSGKVYPEEPASPSDPLSVPEAAYVEDTAIKDLIVTVTNETYRFVKSTRDKSLLEGVDTSNPNIRRLFKNLMSHFGDEIDEALLENADV